MNDSLEPAQGLRADARRNHERILEAARALLADQGPGFGINDVAIRAGVGLRTVYRRFARREDLISALFERYVADEVRPMVEAAVSHVDPWQGLVNGLEAAIVSVANNSALLQAAQDTALVTRTNTQAFIEPLGRALVRAQTAGAARTDLNAADFPSLIAMVVATMLAVPELDSEQPVRWRRYLALLLDGCRAGEAKQLLP